MTKKGESWKRLNLLAIIDFPSNKKRGTIKVSKFV